jgi:hypothetical protein
VKVRIFSLTTGGREMNYSGIDLHSNNCVVVVSDEVDRVLCKRRVPNELGRVLALLEPYRAELAGVVVESPITGTGWSMVCRRRAIGCIWPTLLRSSSMRG